MNYIFDQKRSSTTWETWESGLIRQLKALVLRGMGSSPIEVTSFFVVVLVVVLVGSLDGIMSPSISMTSTTGAIV